MRCQLSLRKYLSTAQHRSIKAPTLQRAINSAHIANLKPSSQWEFWLCNMHCQGLSHLGFPIQQPWAPSVGSSVEFCETQAIESAHLDQVDHGAGDHHTIWVVGCTKPGPGRRHASHHPDFCKGMLTSQSRHSHTLTPWSSAMV